MCLFSSLRWLIDKSPAISVMSVKPLSSHVATLKLSPASIMSTSLISSAFCSIVMGMSLRIRLGLRTSNKWRLLLTTEATKYAFYCLKVIFAAITSPFYEALSSITPLLLLRSHNLQVPSSEAESRHLGILQVVSAY